MYKICLKLASNDNMLTELNYYDRITFHITPDVFEMIEMLNVTHSLMIKR